MLVTDVMFWESKTSSKTKVICTLGWDDKLEKIVILSGSKVGEQILKDRFLDKRCPEKFRYIKAEQGKDFIKNLCFGLTGSRVWAKPPYEKNTLKKEISKK